MSPPVRAARARQLLAGGCAALLLAAFPAHAEPWRGSVLVRPEIVATVPAAADSGRALPPPAPASPSVPPVPLHAPEMPSTARQPALVFPIAGGLAGAAAGAVGGVLIGNASNQTNDDFLPSGAMIGYLIGEGLVPPVGVHLGNARRGSFLADLGVSALGAAGALGIGVLANSGPVYVAGLAGQLALTVWAERATAARRLREAEAERTPPAHGESRPAPPPEPEPLVPPPPPVK